MNNEQKPFSSEGGSSCRPQLCHCLGENCSFLQGGCRAIAKALGCHGGATSRPEPVKIHQAEVRALGEGHILTVSQRVVGNETEL